MSLLIDDNSVVSMHYKMTDDDGNMLESSEDSGPSTYLHGSGDIIPGLEKALAGKVEGDALQVKVEPEDAYGYVIPELIQTVDKAAFQDFESVEVGMMFDPPDQNGSVGSILVTKVEGDEVTIDANHPLAGIVLHFDIEIISVREAIEEELRSGEIQEMDEIYSKETLDKGY